MNGIFHVTQKGGLATFMVKCGWRNALNRQQEQKQKNRSVCSSAMVMTVTSRLNLFGFALTTKSFYSSFRRILPIFFSPWMLAFSVPSSKQCPRSSVASMPRRFQDSRKQNGSSVMQRHVLSLLLQRIFTAAGEVLAYFRQMSIESLVYFLVVQQHH